MERLQQFLNRHSGLALDRAPLHFVQSRLEPMLRARGLRGLPDLAGRLASGDRALGCAVIEAMATHETSFFRDRAVFACLEREILPRLLAARGAEKRLRLWSAACSTGQEAYSIAILLDEAGPALRGWCVDIAASDLSARAIAAARQGRYNRFEVQRGLSVARMLRYFTPEGEDWVVAEHLRARIGFRTFNLLDDLAPFGTQDIVLCRNLFLYFDEARTRDLLARFARIVAPDGVLIVGAAETLRGLTADFVPHPHQAGVLLRANADLRRGGAAQRVAAAADASAADIV